MKLRTRLFLLVAGTVTLAVALVTWFVSVSAREAFEAVDRDRTSALVGQLRREVAREGEEVARQVERIMGADAVRGLALDLAAQPADLSGHLTDAGALAATHGLDFLELVSDEGTIVSSAQWPARFGYTRLGLVEPADGSAFLQVEDLPDGRALGLLASRRAGAGDVGLRIVGGRRLDSRFLASLGVPAGMRALLYRNLEPGFVPQELIDGAGPAVEARQFEPLVARVRATGRDAADTVPGPDGRESFQAVPLAGADGTVVAVLLVGGSHRELSALVASIQRAGMLVAGVGLCLGFGFSYLLASRVTRPIERLADGARRVAEGQWDVRVDGGGSGEVGALSAAFNGMTEELVEQRERLVQAERVAAWRELARRLAHELKNPLFPLRITVDNLQRARHLPRGEFDEVFDESTTTLMAGLANLTGIIARFSDFAKMPKPEFETVALNDVVRGAVALFDAQRQAPGRPPIAAEVSLAPGVGEVRADPAQLARAVQNLVLNAIDAMPNGGTLTVRTSTGAGVVRIDVGDTGEGLTEEERTRLFTPYYTTKQHGTGLGLAIVQSVVSDHHGRIWVESEPGHGATFKIELPQGDAR